MVREIIKDPMLLNQPGIEANEGDTEVIRDLIDTLKAHSEECVGMAANMIGINKRIIAVSAGPFYFAMLNPKIVRQKGAYHAEESCLSLEGKRDCTRFKEIEVEYLDEKFRFQRRVYKDFIAEIIQHEIDHCNGIII